MKQKELTKDIYDDSKWNKSAEANDIEVNNGLKVES